MFRKFRVQNFMCLKDVTVELSPLTIFVGPNSSGKSALFKALVTFSRAFWYPVRGKRAGEFYIEPGVGLDDVVWNGDSGRAIAFEVWFAESNREEPDYTMELRRGYPGWSVTKEKFLYQGEWIDTSQGFTLETSEGTRSWPGPFTAPLSYLTHRFRQDTVAAPHVQPLQDLRFRLGNARRYRPSASDIASFTKPMVDKAGKERSMVDEAGRGLGPALRDILAGDRKMFHEIEGALADLHDHIESINFRSDWRGVGFTFKTSRVAQETPAILESDGVLLSTFLLWRLYTAPPHLKLCLEEPENGVNLWAMKQRYELLRQFAMDQERSHNVQILVATHSRDFLNAIESRTDIFNEVRMSEFDPEEGTSLHRIDHYRQVDELLKECKYQMGDLWWSRRLDSRLRQ